MTAPYPQFHTKVDEVSKSLYESGHFTDALRSASIKLEEYCREILLSINGASGISGQILISKLFNFTKDGTPPLIIFYNISTREGKTKQDCMYKMFSGFVGVVRNQLAHSSAKLDDLEALYGLNIASYLFYKLEEAYNKLSGESVPVMPNQQTDINSVEAGKKVFEIIINNEDFKKIKFEDLQNYRLAIKNILDSLVVENLENLGNDIYNFYFSSAENQEKVIQYILENNK